MTLITLIKNDNIISNLASLSSPSARFGFRISDFGFRISDFGFQLTTKYLTHYAN
jgi:hypothetical protein